MWLEVVWFIATAFVVCAVLICIASADPLPMRNRTRMLDVTSGRARVEDNFFVFDKARNQWVDHPMCALCTHRVTRPFYYCLDCKLFLCNTCEGNERVHNALHVSEKHR